MATVPSTRPRRWPWLLLIPAACWLLIVQSGLQVDPRNDALKAPGTPEAAQVERLARVYGGDDSLALAFATRTHEALAPLEEDAVDELRDALRRDPGVRSIETMPAPSDDLAVLVVDLARSGDADAILAAARAQCPPTLRLLGAGLPLTERAIANGVAADRDRLVPIIGLSLWLLAAAFYRSIWLATAAVMPAFLAILLLGAGACWLDRRLDPVLVLLEPVTLTVGVAAAVHFLAAYRRARGRGHGAAAAAWRARIDLVRPATLATATTMLGFVSLALHPIPAVADFGVLAAIGTALCHGLCMVLLPRWLSAFGGGAALLAGGPTAAGGSRMRCYTAWLLRQRSAIVLLTVLVGVGATALWCTQRVDNDPLRVLPAEHPLRVEFDEFCALLGGAETMSLVVDRGSTAQEADRLLPFVADIASSPAVAGPAGGPRAGVDGSVMVPLRLRPGGSAARSALIDRVEARARALGWSGIHAAGLPVQIARDSDRLVRGQMLGMAIALVGIGLGLLAGLRSLRLGLLGLLPNALPCLLLYGGLAALGRPLTAANAMIGSVMLGLVVDNTIHLLHRFRAARGPQSQRVAAALDHVVRPMLISSVVLATGFGAGMLGSMATAHEFAALSIVAIGLALVGDAVVLPALLLLRPARSVAA